MSLLAVASSLILLLTSKGDGAPETMTPRLWQQIATDYVGAKSASDGTTLPTAAECRRRGAAFAVLATFDRIAVLPGGAARDPDRAYAVARFSVRNCYDDIELPTKAVVLQSEPLESALAENDALGARVWARPVRATLGRNPLRLDLKSVAAGAAASVAAGTTSAAAANTIAAGVSRIFKVNGDEVLIDFDPSIPVGAALRVVTPPGAPPNDALLVVVDITRRAIRALVVHAGAVPVRTGDIVAPR